jgi:hypothetical protein
VPLTPKELTAASRGLSPRGHGVSSVTTWIESSSQGIAGFGCRKWRFFGMASFCSERTTFMRLATPAADSR